ncbi:MAG: ankyrin repeat domain-containing protein [Oxalobacteraceae bacterium]|nr:ankyrin repeat domain-containing protein [Oxalobacteraceae bacterium]
MTFMSTPPIQHNTASPAVYPPAQTREHMQGQRQNTQAPPHMNPTNAPADPRGTKRPIDEVASRAALEDTNEPQFKRVRTEPQQVDPNLRSLFEAIDRDDGELVQSLLKQAPELRGAYTPNSVGATPLCYAAHRGNTAIVTQLLALGEPVDAAARNGSTPLMFAAETGQAECVRLLCKSGANPNAFGPISNMTPLCYAIWRKNIEICKLLISLGADLFTVMRLELPSEGRRFWGPFINLIVSDFSPLIAWLLETQKLTPNSIVPATNQCPVLNFSAGMGAVSIVKLLLEQGANPLMPSETSDGKKHSGALERADIANKFHSVECILRFRTEAGKDESAWPVEKDLKKIVSKDLYRHLDLWIAPTKCITHGLKSVVDRNKLRSMLEKMARGNCMEEVGQLVWDGMVADGWSAHFSLANEKRMTYFECVKILEKNAFKRPLDKEERSTSAAQQLQMLIEELSFRCGLPTPFSGLRLTAQTEQVMNGMFDLQRNLMLEAIEDLRSLFAEKVRQLPSQCMNVFISRTNQLNEADLYRMLTGEWGLYDPVARAVVRLAKEAWGKLQQATKQGMPAEFSALTESEQLRHVIVDLLEEWDKIPELVETLLKCDAQELDFTSDLLFQQWRLFGEAFGVTKPRYSLFGPQRVEAEPLMEVAGNDSESLIEEQVEDI